ncbi:MAG: hypothetical protein JW729_00800 [Bacteroidales bacterium]|nr:hypothetical protein [Bacteroidales bacterium]
MKNKNLIYGIVISFLFVFSGCQKLAVENLNNPDSATVLANPDDLGGLAGGIINGWFQKSQEYDGIALTLWVGADAGTCSWGNAAMRDFSNEPRNAWNNDAAYSYANVTRTYYLGMNNVLALSNQIINQIVVNGAELQTPAETAAVEAVGRFGQALGMGYIGIIFDKGFIVDETVNLESDEIPAVPYTDMINAALVKLDQTIAICNANTFTLPSAWIPGETWTNVELGKLANSMAARLLVNASRNAAENAAVDWARVKTYASNGIDFDFAPLADDITWYSLYQTYSVYGGWGQVDMRVIHMMDPNMPDYFPTSMSFDDLPNQGVATSADARLESDFEYLSSCPFRPERGSYHFSSYRYARLDPYLATWTTPMPEMRKAENDMLLAEAKLMTGDVPGAAAIVNAGTRVTRGGLAPVAAVAADVAAAIKYERTIELFLTGFGLEFFDMRRADMLQVGTPLHFPIPQQQLDVMLMENYTFGGVANADGVNTSNGGWNSKKSAPVNTNSSTPSFGGDDLPRIK